MSASASRSGSTSGPVSRDCLSCPLDQQGLCDSTRLKPAFDRISVRYVRYAARRVLYRAGTPLSDAPILCEGWALKQMLLPSGRKHAPDVILPGELFAVLAPFVDHLWYDVVALTPVKVAYGPRAALTGELANEMPAYRAYTDRCVSGRVGADSRAALWAYLSAEGRLAHFLIDLVARLERLGHGADAHYPFPLTQAHLADILGLTPIHTNRVLRTFRERGMLSIDERTLRIKDRQALEDSARS